jgi:hypothetical protein
MAYLKVQFFHTTRPSAKLSNKFLGPFEVIHQPGPASFTFKLPPHMRAVHPVFHVSMLQPTTPDVIPGRVQPLPPLVEIDGEDEFEIHAILDSKLDRRFQKCPLRYFIQWAGYAGSPEEFQWIAADELAHVPDLLEAFHQANLTKPGPN